MTLKSKSIGRWIGEALLVFGSVIGAFYFEDFREDLREKEQYVNILLNLRNDIHDDIYDFRINADTAKGLSCRLCQDTTELGYLNRYLRYNVGDRDSAGTLIFYNALTTFTQYRFLSPYYAELIKYSDLIEKDSLRSSVSLYYEIFLTENESFKILNDQNKSNAQLIQRTVDYTSPEAIDKLIDNMELRNRLLANYQLIKSAIGYEMWNASDLSNIVRMMDSKLAHHKIDTSSLDKRWLINTYASHDTR